MDKLAKVRAEIERLIDRKDPNTYLGISKIEAYKDVLSFIDSIQEEPKECMYSKDNYTDEDRKVLCDGCEEECRFNKKEEPVSEIDFEQELYKYFGQVKDFTLGMRIAKRFYEIGRNYQETVSEDLEQAAQRYNEDMSWCWEAPKYPHLEAFKAGANWQEKKDQETIETAIHHAYHNGKLEMKQQMMAKAVDGDITFDYYGDDDKTYGCVAHNSFCLEDLGLKDTDKVKMVLINE